MTYDAIVIGARVAGSPTAMLLARKGYRVLLLDKTTFPSDTMSTHAIAPVGIARLKRWGVLDRVIRSNCPPVPHWLIDVGPFALDCFPPPVDGITDSYIPRRKVLDTILVEAAGQAGVEVREGFTVQEILMENEQVVGVRGRSAQGELITEKATMVIGADGLRSLLARQVQAPTYHTRPTLNCAYYAYWSGVPLQGGEIYNREHCTIFAFPTNDNLTCLVIEWSVNQFPVIRTDVIGHFMKTLERFTAGLAERVKEGGRQEERFVGTADLPNFFRKPYGPGWALVGDAGLHQDPIMGHGIGKAFRDAELLVDALDEGFSGRQPLLEALADYERRRNEVLLPLYELNYQFATHEPPSQELQQLFQALRTNSTERTNYIGAITGCISPTDFFAPENVARILATANVSL
jgi:flavin-dependent dehydrogenase